jgi:heme oxygenase
MVASERSILRALKQATYALHRRAEQHVRILDRDATVYDYVRYLCAIYGFHAPIEHTLATDDALEAAGFAAALRRKTPLLAQDLCPLDGSCGRPCDRAAVCCRALPVSDSLARRIGIAYVIEGSTRRNERRAAEAS